MFFLTRISGKDHIASCETRRYRFRRPKPQEACRSLVSNTTDHSLKALTNIVKGTVALPETTDIFSIMAGMNEYWGPV
jgi:hypothetical protein